jgi:methionine synthase II (cobalamin-independent)
VQERSIKDIVELQHELGYRAVTDGEYGRFMFWGGFFENLEGYEHLNEPNLEKLLPHRRKLLQQLNATDKPATLLVCTGKIKHKGSANIDDFNYLKTLVPKDEVKYIKVTLPAPQLFNPRRNYMPEHIPSRTVYNGDDDYFADLSAAFRTELKILYDAGCRNIQFDDPALGDLTSANARGAFDKDPAITLDQFITLYNLILADQPSDLHIGLHICRGNFKGAHFSAGSYAAIAKRVFNEVNLPTFYLEYDSDRAGSFEPLKELPKNKHVVLGVVTTKAGDLEDLKALKERVREAAKYVAESTGQSTEEALKRISVSPQCGFASHSDGNPVTREDMVQKLKLIRSLANELWPGEP